MSDTNEKKPGFRKMMFITQFEELGFDALQSLLVLRGAGLEHIVLLNVIEREGVTMHRGHGYDKDEERRLREQANIRFIDWAEVLFEQGMEVGDYIVVGNVVAQAMQAVAEEDADLIVIGQRKRKMIDYFYSGDDIIELIRRSPRPLMIYKELESHSYHNACLADNPFARPLLAVDWSPASMLAIEYLKTLKNVVQEISVTHVAAPKDLKGSSNLDIQKLRKEKRGRLAEICETLEAEGIDCRPHIYVGEPFGEILRAAREFNATMIVMGASGRSLWQERWIGSTPRAVVEKTPYPVLITPHLQPDAQQVLK
ncbi:MAG: universal stress protein [Thermodesulfobacteriota bacterium]|nr:universal stress protein [Thermodesulfobacteriota bacterium]